MNKTKSTQIFTILNSIEGSGSFESSGINPFILPGLHIEDFGELGLPAVPMQIKALIKLAHQAPFGQGSETVTDTSVRNSWEVNADQLSFKNPEWNTFLEKTLTKVKKGLGIEEQEVSASLYKLLIYEKGGFFLPHKDSEKEKGMFGTLIVGLPSTYTGGEVVVRFGGEEEVFDLAVAASNYKIPHLAFFADCEHEIKPVQSGYRLALVYNLVQKTSGVRINSPEFSNQTSRLASLLKSWLKDADQSPKVVLLGHQYTPANFSLEGLKSNDLPRAETLMKAAEQAGYFAKLGLLTSYLMGQLEEDYYYSRRSRYQESSDSTMGEVYEESMTVENWASDGLPQLGELPIASEDILADFEINDDNPIEQEEEGFTGNAGMTIEYWYHYGAVILWQKAEHAAILAQRGVEARLEWLDWYIKHWDSSEHNSKEMAKALILSFASFDTDKNYNLPDFSAIASALIAIEDVNFIKEKAQNILAHLFVAIKLELWVALWQAYPKATFDYVFKKVGLLGDIYQLNHALAILQALWQLDTKDAQVFVLRQLEELVDCIDGKKLHQVKEEGYFYGLNQGKRKTAIFEIVEKIIALSTLIEDAGWQEKLFTVLKKPLPRAYANDILVANLLQQDTRQNNTLAKSLYDWCEADLVRRTAVEPTPPADWTRPLPSSKSYQKHLDILKTFMASPTQKVFNYTKNERFRKDMAYAIKDIKVDLRMETIRSGRPYTLQITKTQAAYEEKWKIWKEDVDLLEKLKAKE